jgi:outer membrane protein with beta-barrel domain
VRRNVPALALLIGCLIAATTGLHAQEPGTRFGAGVKAGPSFYDLDGTGTGFVGGPVGYLALNRTFMVEVDVPVFDHSVEIIGGNVVSSERTRLLLPEIGLLAQAYLGGFRPYLVVGGGAAIRLNGFVDGGGTLHAGFGARVAIGQHTFLRGEARARSIRPWTGETVDVTLGIEWTSH